MGRVIAGMTTSVDGFVADRNGSSAKLYPDLQALQGSDYMNGAIKTTGAVVMGRRTFGMADPDAYLGNYEFQVPIFVLTHRPPEVAPKQDEHLSFTFVTDGIESAVAQAKKAAGDKAVSVVGGVDVVRQLLLAGLVDELQVDIMPAMLGEGIRLLDDSVLAGLELEKLAVREVGDRTSLRFRVKVREELSSHE